MRNMVLCFIIASLGTIGCRGKSQDEWLREHANAPTMGEVARGPAKKIQPPAGPTEPSTPQVTPAGSAQPRVPAMPMAPAVMSQGDEDMAKSIRASMARDPALRDKMALIDITVRNGRVTLTGLVPDAASKSAAEAVTYEAVGTDNVMNQLTIMFPFSAP